MTCLWTPVLAPPALIASVTGLDTKITGHNQLLDSTDLIATVLGRGFQSWQFKRKQIIGI
ncbi:hypothetical protein QC763_0020920 [Podospora pseudopauciseta]|uniref:Uncharacterized protein n=2 Tax=Podospora TaxID=5144 RepID=A0ABR0I2D4_9PEZI|nr:hypothetical protein QC763_0020920 [Podospora pseudopauciseta]KAK4682603.1 hypothetical protein QC764_0020880 [Podospora pseudoanserina]